MLPNYWAAPDGRLNYSANDHWAQVPSAWSWTEVSAIAIDSRDRVFVFNRGDHPVMIFDAAGSFIAAWGEGQFARAHGITIGPDDAVYCVDDLDHTVKKFTPDGKLLLTLGRSGQPSDTGATSVDYREIRRVGPPFNFPTNLAVAPSGELYVADGYGNARIHRFTATGEWIQSWGALGREPGQFQLPHGIAIHADGTVFVADRENSRLQLFTLDGKYLDEWRDVARPCQVSFDRAGLVYVAELGYRAGMWPGTSPPTPDATGGRVSIWTRQGELVARWGGGERPTATGDFFAPHDIRVDSQGDVYVAEVIWTAGANRGLVAPSCHTLQKFALAAHAPNGS